jgi:hypothetical protein
LIASSCDSATGGFILSTPITSERKRWFDGTINLPTIIAVISAIGSIAVYGINELGDLKMRITRLEDHENVTRDRFTQIEQNQAALRQDVAGQLRDINGKLDRIMWPEGYANVRGQNK